MKLKITRLITLNILGILLFNILPKDYPKVDLDYHENEDTRVYIEEMINNINSEEQISSRSLEEPRQVEATCIIEFATTYSEELVNYIKQPNVEGFKPNAYICSEDSDGLNQYTIGYGHHGADVKATDTITEEAADRLLRAELDGVCKVVLKHCEYLGGLTQGELDALVDFTFNGGPGMLQKLTNNKTRSKEEIAEHITAYTNHGVRGLVNRRNQEYKWFKGEI